MSQVRDLIESQFSARILQWNEPEDDLGGVVFSAIQRGRLIVAESVALLISALQDEERRPLILMAA